MSLPKYNDLKDIKTLEEINQEIFILQKNLFDLRLKRSTSQAKVFFFYLQILLILKWNVYLF